MSLWRFNTAWVVAALMPCSWPAQSQDTSYYAEQFKAVKAGTFAPTSGPSLFGDRTNTYSGVLDFVQTDVAIPGNNALPVEVSRRFVAGSGAVQKGHFGDWDLNLPSIHGVFAVGSSISGKNHGFGADGFNEPDVYKRCKYFSEPPPGLPNKGLSFWESWEYWHGTSLYHPRSGDQEIVVRTPGNAIRPQDGLGRTYSLVTKSGWQFSCLGALQNSRSGDTKTNTLIKGEGFLAVSPDGVTYQFDWMVTRQVLSLTKLYAMLPNPTDPSAPVFGEPNPASTVDDRLFRSEFFIYPTKITDRHGNTVTYTFDPLLPFQLKEIRSSDGRVLTLTYHTGTNLVAQVFDGSRRWNYAYAGAGSAVSLKSVTEPDGKLWQFALEPLWEEVRYTTHPTCTFGGAGFAGTRTGSINHPSGATGQFTVKGTQHGRKLDTACVNNRVDFSPRLFITRALTEKKISGPGIPTATWTYVYPPAIGGHAGCTACPDTKVVTVKDPRNVYTRYTYGIRSLVNEGQLLRLEEGASSETGAAIRTTDSVYANQSDGPYPAPLGYSVNPRADPLATLYHTPLKSRTVFQQGLAFSWRVIDEAADRGFDSHARPLRIERSGSLGRRVDRVTYSDNLSKWLLGQVSRVREETTGLIPEEHGYNVASGNREWSKAFGILKERYEYHDQSTPPAAGKLKVKYDEGGRPTRYDGYHRGIPQLVTYADGATEQVTVNNAGQIRTHTNAVGTTTQFIINESTGRLTAIDYPDEAGLAYHNTNIQFEQIAFEELGLPAGHWRETVTTGNARTRRFFDALWRPVVTETMDVGDVAGTASVVQRRWDIDGRKVYESYPVRTAQRWDAVAPGQEWVFEDGLGRETIHRTHITGTEKATTTTVYLGGFVTQVTNPRSVATRYWHAALDVPDEDHLIQVQAPEGASLTIQRDVFGKATRITRSGGGASATRSFVHDAYQRLCKTVEPESGATIQAFDGAGNVGWRASGLGLTSTLQCDQGGVPAARMVTYSYDARDRLTGVAYGDGSPSVGRSYTADGLLATMTSAGGTWTYHYNNRRLMDWESLNYGSAYAFSYGINEYGGVTTLSYPHGLTVNYSPNAMGQPKQVSGYASNVTYHPNGAVAGYTLANGVSHSLTQNTRGLPETWRDAGVVQDVYGYDANGNVISIVDQQQGLTSRSMAYDGLDRLVSANGPWGAGGFTYDALDNLRTSTVGGRSFSHIIDPVTNRLTGLTGSLVLAIGYDANGNITQRGAQGFSFDIGNRMSAAAGRASYLYDGHGRRSVMQFADGSVRYQFYGQGGKLLLSRASAQGWAYTAHIYLGDRLIAEQPSNGAATFLHTDALGSPVARTNTAAQLLSRTRYEPYGATVAGSTNPNGIGFTGHVNDPDTGLVYMQQRYFEPLAGRFMSVDPVVTDVKNGSFFGRYHYANNNPYKFLDPDGRMAADALPFEDGGVGGSGSGGGLTISDFVSPKIAAQATAALDLGLSSLASAAAGGGLKIGQLANSGAGAAKGTLFRGGQSLEARLGVDVKAAADGLIHPLAKNGKPQGLSLNLDPKDKFIQQYGGAFPVNSLPEGLQAVQSGKPGHFVIAPGAPMPFERYQQLLNQVQLGNFNIVR